MEGREMYPMEPKDTLRMVHDHQHHLREQVARERLLQAARVERPDGSRRQAPRGTSPHGFLAGAGRLVNSLVARRGFAR